MKGYKDLTTGSPFKNILFFCIPIFIGNIFQQLYSMVDTIIVGQTISLDALAAVGCTGFGQFSHTRLHIGRMQWIRRSHRAVLRRGGRRKRQAFGRHFLCALHCRHRRRHCRCGRDRHAPFKTDAHRFRHYRRRL